MGTTRKNRLLEGALSYAAAGIYVHPLHWITAGHCSCSEAEACKHPGKHPKTEHGVKDATLDPEIITGWWKQWPRANIGIDCERSGRVVVDVDPRHGGDESLKRLVEVFGEDWTLTRRARSGGDGQHLHYKAIDGFDIRSATNVVVDGVPYPGIDIRAAGASIVAPPSEHESGRRYVWESGEATPLLPAPKWLQMVSKKPKSEAPCDDPDGRIYEGRRNDTLTSLGGSLRRKGLPEDQIRAVLLDTNVRRCVPPLEEAEVERIAVSVSGYEPGRAEQKEVREEYPLLTLAEIRTLPEPKWLIPGIIAADSLAMLVGESNIGKTFLALGWCLVLGTGSKWAGTPAMKGPVVYIVGEGNVKYMEKRAIAWEDYTGIEESSFLGMVRFVPRAVPMLDLGHVDAFIAALGTLPQPPVLIVVDTLARGMGGGDENSAQDAGRFIDACDRIRAATGAAILILHHPGKGNSSAFRGSSAFEGAVDTMLGLREIGSDLLELKCLKQRHAELFEPLTFRRLPVGDSCVIVPASPPEGNHGLTESETRLLEVLEAEGVSLTSTQWYAARSGIAESSFHAAKKKLLSRRIVEKTGQGRGALFSVQRGVVTPEPLEGTAA